MSEYAVLPLTNEEIERLRIEHGWLNILHPDSGASITVCSECYGKTDECVPWPCEIRRLIAVLDEPLRKDTWQALAIKACRLEQKIEEFDCPHDSEQRCHCARQEELLILNARHYRQEALEKFYRKSVGSTVNPCPVCGAEYREGHDPLRHGDEDKPPQEGGI